MKARFEFSHFLTGWGGVALIVLATAALMWPGLSGWFLFDDVPNIVANDDIHAEAWSWEIVRRALAGYHGPIGRPLATLSFAFNHVLTGMDPWWFKATNVGIHIANALLVMLFGRVLLGLAEVPAAGRNLIAVLMALVWAIHPLQVSSVLYIVQRMELLVATFTLLALLAYVRGRMQIAGAAHAWRWIALSALMTALALLCKESAVLIPLFALAIEWTLLRFAAAQERTRRFWRAAYVVLLAGTAIGLILTGFYQSESYNGVAFTAYERVLSQFRVLVMYLYWVVAPTSANLTFYHDDFTISHGLLSPWSTIASVVLLAGMVWYAIRVRKEHPLSALGIALFIAAHVLTSSALPLELVFEHRNYFALFGPVLFLADSLRRVAGRLPRFPAPLAVSTMVVALAFLTLLRSATWGDPLSLAVSMAQHNPQSPRAAFDLAVTYLRYARHDPASPLYAKAIDAFERAGTIRNSSPLPEQALILLANRAGRPVEVRWWDSLEGKIQGNALGPQEFTSIYALHAAALKGAALPHDRLVRLFEAFLHRRPHHLEMNLVYADFARIVLKDEKLANKHREQAGAR